MTPKEALQKYNLVSPNGTVDSHYMDLTKALEEYAKWQALAFAQWTAEGQWPWSFDGEYWSSPLDNHNPVTAEDLYSQFLKHQNKPL